MTAREKMIQFRERYKIDFTYISNHTGVSPGLISMIERGHVSHPKIIDRIKEFYSLTDLEAEELLPENRRLHSPKYEPDKYVQIPMEGHRVSIVSSRDLYEAYIAERSRRKSK